MEIIKYLQKLDLNVEYTPNEVAINNANNIIIWINSKNFNIFDVDLDALGGIAIWIGEELGKHIWISCLNNDSKTCVYINKGQITNSSFDENLICQFLN